MSARVTPAVIEVPPSAGARRWASTCVFPLCMVGGVWLVHELLRLGMPAHQINPLLSPLIFASVQALEWIHPYRPEWNRSHGDLKLDMAYFLVTAATVFVTVTCLSYALLPLGEALAGAQSWLHWPHHWPRALQVALALLIAEFGHYWVHRLQHEVPWLWRFHAIHHSAPRLYWLNAGRFHPVDMVLSTVLGFTPLLLLGCDQVTLAYFMMIGAIHNLFQHANIDVRLGPLNYVFSMAELHRWHHSRVLAEADANYGGHLAVWDLLFGTRYLPKGRLPPTDLGLAGEEHLPTTLLAQLRYPLSGLRKIAMPPVRSERK